MMSAWRVEDWLFYFFATWNVLASFTNHIDDTDETYGYWEPLHYLTYGTGLQTWEYAPAYAIRTYAFIYPVSLVTAFCNKLAIDKITTFQIVRALFGLFFAYSESKFLYNIAKLFGDSYGYLTLAFMALSPGILFCSTSFLPSSVSTALLMLCCATWMDRKYVKSIAWGSFAVLWTGWPFVGLIILPIGLHMITVVFTQRAHINDTSNATASSHGTVPGFSPGILGILQLVVAGICIIFLVEVPVVLIDAIYYNNWTSPTINILLYNAIGGSGDELYGIEAVSYYVLNLFLNVGLSWPLSVLWPVVHFLGYLLGVRASICTKYSRSSDADVSSPTVLVLVVALQVMVWFAVLFSRPHKEERFLYPAYPLLAFLGASALLTGCEIVDRFYCMLVGEKGRTKCIQSNDSVETKCFYGKRVFLSLCIATATLLFAGRVYSNYRNYKGYMKLWVSTNSYLSKEYTVSNPFTTTERTFSTNIGHADHSLSNTEVTVCTGSEWYYFPSHFHLPNGTQLKYFADGFTGILPQRFAPKNGTFAEPLQPFNDQNREERSRYVDVHSACDFLVILLDRNKPDQEHIGLRKELVGQTNPETSHFALITTEKVISPEHSPSSLARAYYIPGLTPKSVRQKEYSLYRNTRKQQLSKATN